MVKILEVRADDAALREALASLSSSDAVFLRADGRIVARVAEADVDELIWTMQPEQVERGRRAREEYRLGRTIPLEQVKRKLLEGE